MSKFSKDREFYERFTPWMRGAGTRPPKPKTMKTFRVATFLWPGESLGKVMCYTNYGFTGSAAERAVYFDVEATSGYEAKKIAKRLRQDYERQRAPVED